MYFKYNRVQRILILALLINLVAIAIVPGSTMNAQAATNFSKTSPSNGATGQSLSLTLKWEAAPSNPYDKDTYYKYCYYTSSGSCNFTGTLYTTQRTISGLTKSTKYYWQVQVVYCKDSTCTEKEKHEANGGTVWSFTTTSSAVDPPTAFAKLSPANSSTNIISRVLSWQSSSGATSYQYCYSPNYGDSECTYLGGWKDVGNVTTYTVPNDSNFTWGSRYYWQIRASNSGGTKLANDDTWWAFTTSDLVGTATLVSPTGVINDSMPTYTWNKVSGVTWYYLWVNDSKGNVFKQWYDASLVCGPATCAAMPYTLLNAGNFTWWIQTYNSVGYGPWSNSLTFNTPVPVAPGKPTLVSPSGEIGSTPTPTYTWNQVDDATNYYLWVDGPSGNVIKNKYTATDAKCNGTTCYVKPTTSLKTGGHVWSVQAYNSVGYGPWSTSMSFHVTLPLPPGAATLTSPTGNLGMNNPTYTWSEVSSATYYYLWVDGPSGNVLKQWYTSAQANCGGGSCSVTPAAALANGSYTWKIETWNDAGYGPWSTILSFNTFGPPPGAATLTSPHGDITSTSPTYTWNEVSGATWYYLWVDGPSGNVFKQWYTAAQANCSGGTCSVTPAKTLGGGSHLWSVQTWNDGGYGPWSASMSFTVILPSPPGKATLTSPNGDITSTSPTYTWNEVSGATWYYLWIDGPSGNVFKQWYTAAQANCGGGTCSITLGTTLSNGAHVWAVQTYNDAGYGPWSTGMHFNVNP